MPLAIRQNTSKDERMKLHLDNAATILDDSGNKNLMSKLVTKV